MMLKGNLTRKEIAKIGAARAAQETKTKDFPFTVSAPGGRAFQFEDVLRAFDEAEVFLDVMIDELGEAPIVGDYKITIAIVKVQAEAAR